MADKYVIIEKRDGSQASVIESDFKRHYPDEKYKVIGPETVGAFTVTGVPQPKAARPRPKAKAAKRLAPTISPLATDVVADPPVGEPTE